MRQDPELHEDPGGDEPYAGLALPPKDDLEGLTRAAAACTACHLHRAATQTVFGEGPESARLLLVGEQPGDQEDREGAPFVGPAGRILNEALAEAQIPREEVYVTNAVKHFKWEPRGARRLHKKPNRAEVGACRPWLEAEIDRLQPRAIVALGSTAAQALLGPAFRLTEARGGWIASIVGCPVMPTHHPSALLRTTDRLERERMMAQLIGDLCSAWHRAIA